MCTLAHDVQEVVNKGTATSFILIGGLCFVKQISLYERYFGVRVPIHSA